MCGKVLRVETSKEMLLLTVKWLREIQVLLFVTFFYGAFSEFIFASKCRLDIMQKFAKHFNYQFGEGGGRVIDDQNFDLESGLLQFLELSGEIWVVEGFF